jgi:hypothetical protein
VGANAAQYRALYLAVNDIVVRTSRVKITFNVNANGFAGWYSGEYWATLRPAGDEAAFVRLDRMGGRPNSVTFTDSPDLAARIAALIVLHLEDQGRPGRKP